jgi:diphosphomevalonate decarboxylase
MEQVRRWRSEGIDVCYTLDAGPNVHCLCLSKDADLVSNGLKQLIGVQDIRLATPGGGASITF